MNALGIPSFRLANCSSSCRAFGLAQCFPTKKHVPTRCFVCQIVVKIWLSLCPNASLVIKTPPLAKGKWVCVWVSYLMKYQFPASLMNANLRFVFLPSSCLFPRPKTQKHSSTQAHSALFFHPFSKARMVVSDRNRTFLEAPF